MANHAIDNVPELHAEAQRTIEQVAQRPDLLRSCFAHAGRSAGNTKRSVAATRSGALSRCLSLPYHRSVPSNHPITVHSWADSHLPNINPLVRIDHQFTPEAAAAAAISKLLAKPPGCKAIQHWQSLIIDVPSNRNSFTLPPNIDTIVAALRSGPDISLPLAWTRKFYQRLASAGVVPDWIVCDEEGGWNYWQLVQIIGERQSMPLFEKIFADPLTRQNALLDLLAFSPRDFNSASRHYHKEVLAWSLWTGEITGDALRKVILDTATETFGVTPNASNFGDLIMSFQTYDVNGWNVPARESPPTGYRPPSICSRKSR